MKSFALSQFPQQKFLADFRSDVTCHIAISKLWFNMEKTLDWVEKNALENLRFRLQNAETLAKDASALLTILLAGIGGGMAYAVKGFESGEWTPIVVGAAGFTSWLMLCALVLTLRCILTAELQLPTNEPDNLNPAFDMSIDEARRYELKNIQARINATKVRNQRVAYWMDRVRLAATLSPLAFAAASGAKYLL